MLQPDRQPYSHVVTDQRLCHYKEKNEDIGVDECQSAFMERNNPTEVSHSDI